MSDATSVGKIQLDVEFNKASIDREIGKLNSLISNGFKGMFSGMANQTNSFVNSLIGSMANRFKNFAQVGSGSNEKISKSINKMNTEYEKTDAKIKEIRGELAKLFAEQNEIVKGYEVFPAFSGSSKEESLKRLLEADPKYNELSAQINKLTIKMDPLIKNNEKLATEIEKVGNEAENTGYKIGVLGGKSNKTGNNIEKASNKIKIFGNEMTNSGRKTVGFAHMLDRSFRRVIRRIFVLNLIYKLIRGFMNYLNSALKTNKQFSSSLTTVGTNLRVAFQPIYDFILPALNALMRGVATVTTYIASAISALFGKTYKQSYDAAKGLDSAKKAMDGYGKATKHAKGQLAGFDEINQLDIADDEDAGGGGVGGFEMQMPDTSIIDLTGFEKLKDMLQPTIDSLKNLGLVLEPLKKFAAQGLKDLYKDFLKPVGQWVFGEGLPRFIDALTKGFSMVNWQPINDGLNNLWSALTPFAINVGEGLLWFWENTLVPLGTWTMNNVVPVFLDLLAAAIRMLNSVIEVLKPLGLWLWESFLEPLAGWTGGIIIGVLSGIKDALQGIGDWINNHQGAVQTMAIIIGSFATAWGLVNIAIGAWNVIGVIATGVTAAFGAAIAFLTSPIGIVIVIIGSLITAIVLLWKHWDWIVEKVKWVAEKIVGFFTWLYDVLVGHSIIPDLVNEAVEWFSQLGKWISDTWDNIKAKTEEIWNAIKTFLVETIWNPLKNSVNTIFNSIKTIISDIFDSVQTTVTTIWNNITTGLKKSFDSIYSNSVTIFNKMKSFIKGITDSIEGFFKSMVNGVIKALNFMINGLNKLNVNIPDWVPGIGGKSLGFSIPKIPYLAKGGIIDQPTLAMVGERGKEAVVPLENNTEWMDKLASIIVSAMMHAIQVNSSTKPSNGVGDIILQIDGTIFARIIGPYLDKETFRIGNVVIQPV